MPWNCLCSNKDKRRPEISAPILNNEDIQKLQLIPLKKPLITSEHLQQKLVQPENNNSTTVVIVDTAPDCDSSHLDAVVSCDDKNVQKKQLKQLNKKQKEKQNNKAKPSNLKKQLPSSSTTNPNNVENEKISKQLTNVKFAFEVNDIHYDERKENGEGGDENIGLLVPYQRTEKVDEKKDKKIEEKLNESNGNYDELPLIRIEEFGDATDGSQQISKNVEHFSKSSESIPFIDESPRHQTLPNLFETRYITIQPQNIGSQGSKITSNNNSTSKVESIHTSVVPKREQFDKSAQILYQSQIISPVAHHFEMVQRLDVKLCQVCHEFLLEPKSVRCLTCGFVCHESCVATKPKIRYTDTSYIIFQQWQKGGGKATFPIVYNFVPNPKLPELEIESNKSSKTTDNAIQQNRSLAADKQNGDIVSKINGSIRQKHEPMNGKKLKKRRSRSLDRKRNKRSLVIDDSDGSLYDGDDDIDVVDNARCSSVPVTSHITVDVHRPNSSSFVQQDLNVIRNSSDVPEKVNCNTTLDINHNDLPLMVCGNVVDSDNNKDVTNSVQIRRKKFNPISDSSSFDESSDQDIGYATVERENMKNYDAKTQQSIPKSQSFPLPSQYQKSSDNLGLNYVTERILGSVLPRRDVSDMHQHQQRPHSEGPVDLQLQDKYEKELILMLEQKHGKNYKMFDLESCISTITLEKLCELCKHIDSWLGSGREKVVVLQDRGDKQRLGAAIAAYLKYLDICATNYPKRNGLSNEDIRAQNTIARNWLDLDMFSMRKFLEDVIGPLRVPSHCRYLNYFSGLLSGKIKMNSSPLYLKYVTIESPPSWMNYDSISTQSSEWRSFIKIYEGLNCVFTSDIHVIPISTRQFVYEVGQLRLRGDVIIRCYQLLEQAYQEKRELMFSTQFHTCAVTDRILSFTRSELDYACDDPRFPTDHKVTLNFGNNSSSESREYSLKSPLVTIEPMNAIAKYDSLENFNDASSPHTHGPLDGSLYATILKSPKTPERSSSTIPQFPNVNNNTIVQPIKPLRGSTQNLISPPPEFSNHKKIEITERHSTNGSSYPSVNNNSVHNTNTQIRSSSSLSNRYTPTINYEEIRVPSRSSSREIVLRNSYSHQSTPRPSSSQSQYQDQRSSVSRTSNYTPNPSSYPPSSHQIKAIESYHYTTVDNNNSGGNSTGNYQDGRESVRSPLTLSMDSGISSSGIVNRRVQGSSVSPSSFPSQTSPQEDRQRELDDILSDMLLTVQDIPDIVKCKQHSTLAKKPQQNNQIILTQHQQQIQSPYSYNTDTVKRSHTSSCSTTRDDHHSIITSTSTNTNQGKDRERDFYDTSSTTTTITPPPSESGRDTPIIVHTNNSSNNSTLQHRRDKRESSTTHMQQQHRGTGDNSNREHIMDLQNQSFAYPQQVRTDIVYVTSEDEEIPYHAREDSRPFTYGNPSGVQLSPNGTGMLKMQSGLSSPSLVRKTLGGGGVNTTPRGGDTYKKTNVRNDFEEMLLQRREKILNEKYSIGDKTPNGSAGNQYGETKWSNVSSPTNGYHYHEPLKRSNTMDGGFGRSYSTDETSGQTWLQLQQQKLRAKKEQQNKGADYFERKIHTEIRNRPLRSRSRYDGYASDTAAFDADAFIDEVDYRRPLHVQTPHNRSSDRNYHTITTTTTTKERPFVTVKRAHEQAKLNTIGSSPVSPLSVLNASPHGHISQAQSPNGLLSFADSSTSPRNGHVRLESEILKNGNENSTPVATTKSATPATAVNDNACGQMALDRLLKSLAIENSKIDEHLDQLNNSNSRDSYRNGNSSSPSEIFKFPPPIRDKNHNKIESNNIRTTNDSLNDVIANLTDFTRHETLRQSLTNGNRSPSLVVNNNRQYLEPANNVIKRLASESENSSSISPSLSERSNGVSWSDQVREESFSSYRSETEPETSIAGSPRPETPAFPVTPRTPYGFNLNGNSSPALPPKSPTSMRKDLYSGSQNAHHHQLMNQNDSISCYTSRRNSTTSNTNSEPQEVAPHLVKFVRDSSKYWYKPNISREEAVALLRNAQPGTFIVRDSTTFAKAYGLVVKVAYPPPGVQSKGPPGDELVRHFLVEPTTRGVRLKGCSNEPVFTSLSALVYQHSITPLALPCRLIIPDRDMQSVEFHSPAQQQLITQGAACNVLYLFTCETESLTGPEAVRKAISFLYSRKPLPKPTEVHFKVSHQGITLTDQTRQLFFRKHYPAANISHCGLDPEDRRWSVRAPLTGDVPVSNKWKYIQNKGRATFVVLTNSGVKKAYLHLSPDDQHHPQTISVMYFVNWNHLNQLQQSHHSPTKSYQQPIKQLFPKIFDFLM